MSVNWINLFLNIITILRGHLCCEDNLSNHELLAEKKASYWIKNAQMTVLEKCAIRQNFHMAKNIIFFLGDGMSIPTVTASRVYKGQKYSNFGENSKLSFENFPFTGLIKTYCADKQVADSACSATAFLCGVKNNFATIGVGPQVTLNDCKAAMNKSNCLNSMAAWAQKAGKGTGIVTNTRITHASPAANYACAANRGYECDADVVKRYKKKSFCQDIASQLIFNNPGKNFNVIMGGGRSKFLPKTKKDVSGKFGQRLDKTDLVKAWKNQKKSQNVKYEYISNRTSLKSINYFQTEYLLGLFNSDHMSFHLDNNFQVEPTLSEMTEAAIKILQKYRNGFYLFVESGNIDLAHHNNNPQKALDETIELDKAVESAIRLTSNRDTLIVATADHAHVMTISGYPSRGKNILSLNEKENNSYPILSYANGPGGISKKNFTIRIPRTENLDKNAIHPAMVYLKDETHGGDDVCVYASGPWAHLFTGVYEQNVIPHLIGFASCIGDGPNFCKSSQFY